MAVVSMQQLLEAGVHFGHITRRWNPKMGKFIYTDRNGIHIIDLQKTQKKVEEAYKALFEIAKTGKKVLFVGTRKQAQQPMREEAIRSGQFYVDSRWLGGTLTNFKTIKKRINELHKLYDMEEKGIFDRLPKKEVSQLKKDREKLEKFLGGIKEMKEMPGAIFIVDPKKERNAILEARKLNIPVFGIVDTNCDPDDVDYVIPGNDDAIRAVKLIAIVMANAIVEANGGKAMPIPEVSEIEGEEQPRQRREFNKSDRPRREFNNNGPKREFNNNGPKREFNNNGPKREFNNNNRGPRPARKETTTTAAPTTTTQE